MNIAPFILPSAQQFDLATAKPVSDCQTAIGALVGHKKTLRGTLSDQGFNLRRASGISGIFFAPSFVGQFKSSQSGTELHVVTEVNKLGRALLNAAVCTIIGAVLGVLLCTLILPDAVAVCYAFLCMVFIPGMVLVVSLALGQLIMRRDTRVVSELFSKQIDAAKPSLKKQSLPLVPTLMQEFYAVPCTILLFTGCAFFLHNVFATFWSLGEYIQTEALCRPAYMLTNSVLGEGNPITENCRYFLAESLRCCFHRRESEHLYDQNIRLMKEATGNQRSLLAENMFGMARIADEGGRHQEAEQLYRKTGQIWASTDAVGPNSMWVAKALDRLAMVCLKEGKFDQSMTAMKQALEIDRAQGAKAGDSLGEDLNDLGLIYDQEDKLDKAYAAYTQALNAKEQALGKTHYSVGTTLNNLADIEGAIGHKDKAERDRKRADTIWLAWLGPDYQRLYPNPSQQYHELVKDYIRDYERPHSDTREDALRPYLGRY